MLVILGIPPVIYLCLNRTILLECIGMFLKVVVKVFPREITQAAQQQIINRQMEEEAEENDDVGETHIRENHFEMSPSNMLRAEPSQSIANYYANHQSSDIVIRSVNNYLPPNAVIPLHPPAIDNVRQTIHGVLRVHACN
jgi:hypothetical protein